MILINLKSVLKETHMSARELSRRTGISYDSISSYVSGRREPSVARVKLIANALGVSTDKLLGRVPNKKERISDIISYIELACLDTNLMIEDKENTLKNIESISEYIEMLKHELRLDDPGNET